jgi:glutamate dehydrogenase
MGITARGAWECVKRHFRELGTDIQMQDFTCVGVGDMSGLPAPDAFCAIKLSGLHHRDIFSTPSRSRDLVQGTRYFAPPHRW